MKQKNDKKNVKKNNTNSFDIKGFVITIVALICILGVIYGLTLGAQNLGWFDLDYFKPEVSKGVISYNNILAGTIFDRNEEEYYVLIADFSEEDSIYLSSLYSMYQEKEDKISLYIVDLNDGMNKTIIGSESNPDAQEVDELNISDFTLIKIIDGENVLYVEGVENIESELEV